VQRAHRGELGERRDDGIGDEDADAGGAERGQREQNQPDPAGDPAYDRPQRNDQGGIAFDMAEDAVQEALLAAAQRWPAGGVPEDPKAWLITVAARRLSDLLVPEAGMTRRITRVKQTVKDSGQPFRMPPPDARGERLTALRHDHRWHAVRGRLLALAGDQVAARSAFEAAAQRTMSLQQKRYLLRRAAAMPEA
jgi:predicted RNA polymerase sigma factor